MLHIFGGPALFLHPENARDLMLSQGESKRIGRAGGVHRLGPEEVSVPAQLQWRGQEPITAQTRGLQGDVLLSAVEVITGAAKKPAADFVAAKVAESADDQVTAGVYALYPESLSPLKDAAPPLKQVPALANGGPLLVFVHGTFSTTSGTFDKLWPQHPQHVRSLFARYAGRVYGLEHPTLSVSPISNALTLAQALPKDTRHLSTICIAHKR